MFQLSTSYPIVHFTVVCSDAWPLNETEVGVHLVLKETFLVFYDQDVVIMLIRRNLLKKSGEVSIKTRSTPASLSFRG